ncbi:hypothetical protein ABBQ38_009168 [Trebouxia sp. C0009 RCD-2024]
MAKVRPLRQQQAEQQQPHVGAGVGVGAGAGVHLCQEEEGVEAGVGAVVEAGVQPWPAEEGRCLFLFGKKPSRTPDEPEMCRNNGLDCTRRSVHREKSPRWGWQNVTLAAGMRTLSANAPDLPWCCNAQQLETSRARCKAMRQQNGDTCLPSGWTQIEFEKALGMPGVLKTSEYILLQGPIGKYILEGCMHTEQQAAVFEYLDVLGSLWEKTISLERLAYLEKTLPVLLTRLEHVLPIWVLDINRHMILHLIESIRNRFPEATIMNTFRAFTVASTALAGAPTSYDSAADISDPRLGFATPAAAPFYHLPRTFNEETFELELPSFTRGRCLFLYGKRPSRTPDEPEMCRNNGLDCTRRSVHREKSPRWGWQNVLGP